MARRTEEEHLKYLAQIMPMLSVALSVGTFVLIRMAGHGSGTALLVAAIMFGFVMLVYQTRRLLGINGALALMVGGALAAWLLLKGG